MEQLLEMKTVPMLFELKVTNAKLEMDTQNPTQQVTREDGSFTISHSFPKLHIDTYEARASMGLKSVARVSQEEADNGMQAALNATAQIAQEGNMLMNIQNGDDAICRIAAQSMQNTLDSTVGAIPSVPANIQWEPQQLSMQYEADKLSFDWRTQNKADMKFTPADVQFLIKQYPSLEINYVGGPIYAPPSSDPNYEPPALDVTA